MKHYNTIMLKGKYLHYGEIATDYGLFHQIWLYAPRESGAVDTIPVRVPEYLMDEITRYQDDDARIAIQGEIRQCIKGGHSSLWVEALQILPPMEYYPDNEASMRGELCKYPVYRVTPFGKEICDMMLAVRRISGRADHIPILTWSELARRSAGFCVGDMLDIRGRFQSREYTKKSLDGRTETRVVYEVSVYSYKRRPKEDCRA